MSKYKIIETIAINATEKFIRDYVAYRNNTPSMEIYEVWEFKESRLLFWKSAEWRYVDRAFTLKEAKNKIFKLKGKHPDDFKLEELRKEQPKVVYEE